MLVSYLEKNNTHESFNPEEKLSKLCTKYIGNELLSAKLDSTKQEHYRIVHDYLLTQKALNNENINIIMNSTSSTKATPADNTKQEFAYFYIDIKASENE